MFLPGDAEITWVTVGQNLYATNEAMGRDTAPVDFQLVISSPTPQNVLDHA